MSPGFRNGSVVLSLKLGNKIEKYILLLSIQALLLGVLRYTRNVHGDTPDFLSKKDWRFQELRGTMERILSDLRKQGVGAEVNIHQLSQKKHGRIRNWAQIPPDSFFKLSFST